MKKLKFFLLLSVILLSFGSCKASVQDSNAPSTGQQAPVNKEEQSTIATMKSPADTAVPGPMGTASLVFSAESGFYEASFELSITAPKGSRVYYTLDGSVPDDNSAELKAVELLSIRDKSKDPNAAAMIGGTTTGQFYAPTILIDKATIVRAVAYDSVGYPSEVVTKSYFVGFHDKAEYYSNVSIISLVTDPENLFNYDTGIYVTGATFDNWKNSTDYNPKTRYWHQPANYKNSGQEWERPAHIDFFEKNGELGFTKEIGIRMRGGASRAFLQKSFNLYARGKYGSKSFKYDIFPDLTAQYDGKSIEKFDSLMLRNGGNDTELTKIREVLIHEMSSELNVSVQASRPVIVFLNGEYWGLYNLQEKYSEDYIESHYGVDKDNVIIIKTDTVDEGEEADIEYYHELFEFAQGNDLSDQNKYDEFSKMLDISSFIDYVSTEVFIGNVDWGTNNVMLWCSRTAVTDGSNPYEDGRWRFMLYDTEYSTGLSYENSLAFDARYNPSNVYENSLGRAMNPGSTIGKLFSSLSANKAFCRQFKARFFEIADTAFERDHVLELLEQYADTYRPMMADTLLRYRSITEEGAIKQFDYEVDKIRKYFTLRHDYIKSVIDEAFKD